MDIWTNRVFKLSFPEKVDFFLKRLSSMYFAERATSHVSEIVDYVRLSFITEDLKNIL